jgi:hypothetical protein
MRNPGNVALNYLHSTFGSFGPIVYQGWLKSLTNVGVFSYASFAAISANSFYTGYNQALKISNPKVFHTLVLNVISPLAILGWVSRNPAIIVFTPAVVLATAAYMAKDIGYLVGETVNAVREGPRRRALAHFIDHMDGNDTTLSDSIVRFLRPAIEENEVRLKAFEQARKLGKRPSLANDEAIKIIIDSIANVFKNNNAFNNAFREDLEIALANAAPNQRADLIRNALIAAVNRPYVATLLTNAGVDPSDVEPIKKSLTRALTHNLFPGDYAAQLVDAEQGEEIILVRDYFRSPQHVNKFKADTLTDFNARYNTPYKTPGIMVLNILQPVLAYQAFTKGSLIAFEELVTAPTFKQFLTEAFKSNAFYYTAFFLVNLPSAMHSGYIEGLSSHLNTEMSYAYAFANIAVACLAFSALTSVVPAYTAIGAFTAGLHIAKNISFAAGVCNRPDPAPSLDI